MRFKDEPLMFDYTIRTYRKNSVHICIDFIGACTHLWGTQVWGVDDLTPWPIDASSEAVFRVWTVKNR